MAGRTCDKKTKLKINIAEVLKAETTKERRQRFFGILINMFYNYMKNIFGIDIFKTLKVISVKVKFNYFDFTNICLILPKIY